ncbi:MAG: glycosyltransferase, partial [Chloroflexota bacterium]
MNIGIVIPGFSDGEQDWCIPVYLNLVRTLAQSDSLRVFAMRYPLRRDQYTVYGAQVIALGGGSYTVGVGRVALIARTIAMIIRQHRIKPFDVLHAIWADETGFAACIAGRLIKVPVVVSVAGGELVGLPGYGLQSGRVSAWLVKQALILADCVTVPCQYAFDLLPSRQLTSPQPLSANRERFPEPIANRTAIVPLGVDPILFSPSSETRIENRLLAVGSLSNVKGHDKLLHALAQLPDLSLDIVGEGPLLSELSTLAETLGVAARVTFHGAVAHDALPRFYRSAA